MLDQNTFIETVQSVAEIIRTSAEPIGRDEIMSYFKDMELNKAQEDMVFEFLITPHEQENESAGDYEDEPQDELHGDESSENAALNNVIYSEGDSMDAIAGGKNNKAKQDNEAVNHRNHTIYTELCHIQAQVIVFCLPPLLSSIVFVIGLSVVICLTHNSLCLSH